VDRIVVGLQPVREAIRARGNAVRRVAVERGAGPRIEALARFAEAVGIETTAVSRGELDRLSGGARHQGAVALAPPLRLTPLEDLSVDGALVVVLDGITDPQNFGAVIRSAVALGATAVVWGEHHAAPLGPATGRASAGAVEHATLVCVRSLRAAVAELGERGLSTVALEAGAATPLPAVDLKAPCAIVIGAEDTGVSRGVRRLCAVRAALPMQPVIDSLNASVAAALALYEACRQRMTGLETTSGTSP
jgi:23S rRNA (guanosine2251-2'-O)-methyltransferase